MSVSLTFRTLPGPVSLTNSRSTTTMDSSNSGSNLQLPLPACLNQQRQQRHRNQQHQHAMSHDDHHHHRRRRLSSSSSSSFKSSGEWSDPAGEAIPLDQCDSFEDDIIFINHGEQDEEEGRRQQQQQQPRDVEDLSQVNNNNNTTQQDGVEIPEFMQPLLGGLSFVPFPPLVEPLSTTMHKSEDASQGPHPTPVPLPRILHKESSPTSVVQDFSTFSCVDIPANETLSTAALKTMTCSDGTVNNSKSVAKCVATRKLFSSSWILQQQSAPPAASPAPIELGASTSSSQDDDEKEEEEEEIHSAPQQPQQKEQQQQQPHGRHPFRRLLASINSAGKGSPIISKGALVKRFQKSIQSARKNRQNQQERTNCVSTEQHSTEVPPLPLPLVRSSSSFCRNRTVSTSSTLSCASGDWLQDLTLLRKQARDLAAQATQLEECLAQMQQPTEEACDSEAFLQQEAAAELMERVEKATLVAAYALIESLHQRRQASSRWMSEHSQLLLSTTLRTPQSSLVVKQKQDESEEELGAREALEELSFVAPHPLPPTAATATTLMTHGSTIHPVRVRAPTADDASLEHAAVRDWTPALCDALRQDPPPYQSLEAYSYHRSTTWAYPMHSQNKISKCPEHVATEDHLPPMTLSLSAAAPRHKRQRSHTEPKDFALLHTVSLQPTAGSFLIRGSDLTDVPLADAEDINAAAKAWPDNKISELCSLADRDSNITSAGVLDQLYKTALQLATDDKSDAFQPIWETQRLLKQAKCCLRDDIIPEWPFSPWFEAPAREVLVWTHNKSSGFGNDWPVVKVRAQVKTSAKALCDFLLDSSKVGLYNKMSQGRFDVAVLSVPDPHAIVVKVMRALNKPKLSPKTFETLSLCYCKSLHQVPNAYMIVHRSVWESRRGGRGNSKNSNNAPTRSEMILNAHLIRPCHTTNAAEAACCELTTLTHVFTPNVPELMAKRMAPGSAATIVREIQALFS